MPTKVLKDYAKEANKSIEEAEACWEKAKKQADKIYGKDGKTKHEGMYWGFVNKATRKCLGLSEKKKEKE